MKPIKINLTISIDDEIDEAIYGGFHSHTRDLNGEPFVQIESDKGAWIPVADWKSGRYIATQDTLRRVARHFIEIGKHIKEDNQ